VVPVWGQVLVRRVHAASARAREAQQEQALHQAPHKEWHQLRPPVPKSSCWPKGSFSVVIVMPSVGRPWSARWNSFSSSRIVSNDAQPTGGTQQPRDPTRRLFFALWPDEALRKALTDATRDALRACGGRPVPSERLHITLAFLGSVPERRIPELTQIAGPLAAAFSPNEVPLRLTFDHIERWKKPQVISALAREESAGVIALSESLKNALAGAGFSPDLKGPWSVGANMVERFRPHVTLARKVMHPIRSVDIHPVLWSFTEFVLVESRTEPRGAVYRVLDSFPLHRGCHV
jgi:2'-5' RNA ligase